MSYCSICEEGAFEGVYTCAKCVRLLKAKLQAERDKWEALRQWVNSRTLPLIFDTTLLEKMLDLDVATIVISGEKLQ